MSTTQTDNATLLALQALMVRTEPISCSAYRDFLQIMESHGYRAQGTLTPADAADRIPLDPRPIPLHPLNVPERPAHFEDHIDFEQDIIWRRDLPERGEYLLLINEHGCKPEHLDDEVHVTLSQRAPTFGEDDHQLVWRRLENWEAFVRWYADFEDYLAAGNPNPRLFRGW